MKKRLGVATINGIWKKYRDVIGVSIAVLSILIAVSTSGGIALAGWMGTFFGAAITSVK
jgi:hypothetical protein